MSSAANTTSTSFNFDAILNAALMEYTKRTGKDLRDHPLASNIDSFDNPESILNIFQEQAQAFDKFKKGDTKLFKWLRPVVDVLHAIFTNEAFSDNVSHVRPATSFLLLLETLSSRCFRPQRRSSPLSTFCCPCVFRLLSPPHCFFTSSTARRPRVRGKVTTPLSISSNALKASLDDSAFTTRLCLLLQWQRWLSR